jgi:hypothetical protein
LLLLFGVNSKDANAKTYSLEIYEKTSKQNGTFSERNSWEAYLKVNSEDFDPDMQLEFQPEVITSESNEFSIDLNYTEEFLVTSALSPKTEKVRVSYSGNFCNELLGVFLPNEDITVEYFPLSGVYHFQKIYYHLESQTGLLQVVQNQDPQGMEIFRNPFAQHTEKETIFMLFCPFKIPNMDFTLLVNVNFKTTDYIDRK